MAREPIRPLRVESKNCVRCQCGERLEIPILEKHADVLLLPDDVRARLGLRRVKGRAPEVVTILCGECVEVIDLTLPPLEA